MTEDQRIKYNAYQREYQSKHRKYFRETSRKWYAKFGSTNKRKFSEYKNAAKRRGLVFKLSFEEFSTLRNGECFYCADRVVLNGIDRVDSSLGYLIDNVVPCCSDCNFMKSDKSVQSFIDRCKKIANRN